VFACVDLNGSHVSKYVLITNVIVTVYNKRWQLVDLNALAHIGLYFMDIMY